MSQKPISMEALSKMINSKKPKHFTEDNFNANHVDSLGVIREVKKHKVIYDMEHERYHDQPYRTVVWEQICLALYPLYREYSVALQLQIGVLVRRRWKSVRNYIAQEAKLMITTEYCRKRESTQWSELQFILPYIKSPYCEQVAAELGITRLDDVFSKTHDSNTNDDSKAQSYGNNSENESFLMHEFIKKEEPCEYTDEDDPDSINEVDDDYPSPLLADPSEDKELLLKVPATNPLAHPVFLHYNNVDRISTPPMLTPRPSAQNHCQLPRIENVESLRKRPCIDSSEDDTSSLDMQRKLLDLLINIEHGQLQAQAENDLNDLDRMFFLSLVPDFKLIPVHKKISVKAKIATIIAESMG